MISVIVRPLVVLIASVALIVQLTDGQQQSNVVGNPDRDELSLVFVIFREGSRNPTDVERLIKYPVFGANFRQDEPWRNGPGRLNKPGKRRAYSFGQFLRKRYGKLLQNTDEDVANYRVAEAYSASSACNQATLQLTLAGLFPVTDNIVGKDESSWNDANTTGLWQPYLYSVDDKLLNAANISCPELEDRFNQIREDATPPGQTWLSENPHLLSLFTERTGQNASLENLANFAEFLDILKLYNSTVPHWLLENDTRPITTTTTTTAPESIVNLLINNNNDSSAESNATESSSSSSTTESPLDDNNDEPVPQLLLTKFLQFRQAHAYLCSNDTDCRRTMSGYFLNHLLETLMLKREEKLPRRKLQLYSSSAETLLSVASLFRVFQPDHFRSEPEPEADSDDSTSTASSGMILEYRDNPQPSVRILSHRTVGENDEVRLTRLETSYCPQQEWCRLDLMIRAIGLDTNDDWDKACKIDNTIGCPSKPSQNIALIKNAISESENGTTEDGKKFKSTECAFEWDKSGTRPCHSWAAHGYCRIYDSVRWLFCRRTCLCNPEFL